MTNNTERRDVARRLREYADKDIWVEARFVADALDSSMEENHQSDDLYCGTVEDIADLIEPEPERTCRNLSDNGWFTCSECGANVYGAAYGSSYVDGDGKRWYTTANPPQWNYCPNCGARVVEEASDDADR